MAIGKRLKKANGNVDRAKFYDLGDAVATVKGNATAKFDETVEIAMNLGIDPRHADQQVRGMVVLPNGTVRPFAWPCLPAPPRPRKPRPLVPIWSAPTIWPSRSWLATWTLTAASPHRI
jgi:hypothetical protein